MAAICNLPSNATKYFVFVRCVYIQCNIKCEIKKKKCNGLSTEKLTKNWAGVTSLFMGLCVAQAS